MSKQWLYRMSPTKENLDATRTLVEEFGFIARSAYAKRKGNPQFIPHVRTINFSDTVHLYYLMEEGVEVFGSFRIVGPAKHPKGEQFIGMVPKTRLLRVRDSSLLDLLTSLEGYEPDPNLGEYTGWGVVPAGLPTPPFRADRFRGRNSIVEL